MWVFAYLLDLLFDFGVDCCQLYSWKITVEFFALIISNSAQKGFLGIRKKGVKLQKSTEFNLKTYVFTAHDVRL